MATPRSNSSKKTTSASRSAAAKKAAATRKAKAEAAAKADNVTELEPKNRQQRRAAERNRNLGIRPTANEQAIRDARKRFDEIMGDEKEEGVTTSIDALAELEAEAETKRDIPPFTIKIGEYEDGESIIIEIGSPEELEYALTVSGNYDAILSHAMSQEDWIALIDAQLTTRQVYLIYTAWRLYYGLPDQGEADA